MIPLIAIFHFVISLEIKKGSTIRKNVYYLEGSISSASQVKKRMNATLNNINIRTSGWKCSFLNLPSYIVKSTRTHKKHTHNLSYE